jgi:Kef-type K+ transport system membrane component KefB
MLASALGNKIIGAAVIDDILGVLVLTVLSKISQGSLDVLSITWLVIAIVLFFLGAYILWSLGIANKIAIYLDTKEADSEGGQHYTRFFFGALILASALAGVVGLEPVLGAFGIGVVLSKVDHEIKQQAWQRIEGYMHIFVGGFLVIIGTMLPREALFSGKAWFYAMIFTALGFAGKYIVRYLFKNVSEGKMVGYAMSIRGEVGLVFVAVAIANNVLSQDLASGALLGVILVTVLGSILFEREVEKNSKTGTEKSVV